MSGTQPGDPGRASDIMIAIAQQAAAPARIVLGAWGFDQVTQLLETRLQDVHRQKELSLSADFPKA
jgi:hypothetical protein